MTIRRTDIDRVVAVAREIRLWANQVGVPVYGIKKLSDAINGDKKVVTIEEKKKVNEVQKEKVDRKRLQEIKEVLNRTEDSFNHKVVEFQEIRKRNL